MSTRRVRMPSPWLPLLWAWLALGTFLLLLTPLRAFTPLLGWAPLVGLVVAPALVLQALRPSWPLHLLAVGLRRLPHSRPAL